MSNRFEHRANLHRPKKKKTKKVHYDPDFFTFLKRKDPNWFVSTSECACGRNIFVLNKGGLWSLFCPGHILFVEVRSHVTGDMLVSIRTKDGKPAKFERAF